MRYLLHQGDVLARLRELTDESVHCVVTSPPYWGLRDYGVEGQIGLEKTPEEYVRKLVDVFREVRRVLRRDGTLWLIVGDTYFGSWGNYGGHNRGHGTQRRIIRGSAVPNPAYDGLEQFRPPRARPHSVLKPKDLAGIPWRLATALQADGWWLRSDIIWSKTNPMPESVSDRPTKSHEYVFLLTKNQRYFYDAEAIKETAVGGAPGNTTHKGKTAFERGDARMRTKAGLTKMSAFARHNKRSVWTIAVEAFPGAHFAVFPKKLIEPCILAGTSEHGCCAACGAPWQRIVSRHVSFQSGSGRSGHAPKGKFAGSAQTKSGEYDIRLGPVVTTSTAGWKPTCACSAKIMPCTVLDPFSGAGTTGLVALRLGRNYIGIELNPEYVAMSRRRIENDAPFFLKETPMRYLSVCSGIEAVSVAWQPLGWQPAMFAEIDPFCCWLLRSRYRASRPIFMPSPHDAHDRKEAKRRAAATRNIVALPAGGDVIKSGDFTKIGKEDVGTIDLLAGGTPCQSFSIAGKRAGLDDPRGNLTIEFARLADRLRPTWLVWENVPGVLSIDGGRTFGAFLRMLVECGYGIAYRVLDAQFFGVPQRRRRVFVVGYLGDWRAPAAVFLEFAGLSGYPPPRRKARQGVAGGVEVGPAGGRFTDTAPAIDTGCKDGFIRNQLGAGVLSSTDETSHCLNAGGMGRQDYETETLLAHTLLAKENDSRDAEKQTYITHALSADGFDASEDGTGRGTPMVPVTICTAHTRSNGSGFSDDVAHTLESGGAQAIAFAQNSRDEVRLHGGDGQTVGALAAQAGVKQQSYIAFSAADDAADAGDVAPTLRSMNNTSGNPNGGGQVAIAFAQSQEGDLRSSDVMHSLGTNANATSRNAPTVAFTLHGSDGTTSTASSTEVAGSLRTRAPGSIENSSTTAVLQDQSVASPLTASYGKQVDSSDTSNGPPNLLRAQMAVRRLTPRECERLQGFPDDYTLVEYRGKLAADGPRYRALGNSMAVPVMRWIGQRIVEVDAILREHGTRREP